MIGAEPEESGGRRRVSEVRVLVSEARGLRAGIVGGGFMGRVHAHAVRAAGLQLTRVAASSPESAERAATAFGAAQAAESAEELVRAEDVDVVHLCVPNALHVPLAGAALDAGKRVICEKPLATTVETARDLARRARGSVTAVPFVYRYYPAVREARARIARGDAGAVQLIHGAYLQDWMLDAQNDHWRADPERGGISRAFADIGVHWCDLAEFTTGHRIARLCARTSSGEGAESSATLMFETDRGALGSAMISQASRGRKNQLRFSLDGETAAYQFDQETPEALWVGGREENRVVHRGEAGQSSESARLSFVPAGHPQGYQDCFDAFVADAYAVAAGGERDGLPTFEDGARAAVITDAVLRSSSSGEWVQVSDEEA
jgi:predicted dehydrogenase